MQKVILLILIVLIGCAGGCDKNPVKSDKGWDGAVNSSGFPDVAGLYSFLTEKVNYTTNTGESGTVPGHAFNVMILQEQNQIVFNENRELPGITITDQTDMSGTVDKRGNFIANKTLRGTTDDYGKIMIVYNLTGQFTTIGWSGDYRYSSTYIDYSVTHTCTTTFTGDKLPTNSPRVIQ